MLTNILFSVLVMFFKKETNKQTSKKNTYIKLNDMLTVYSENLNKNQNS